MTRKLTNNDEKVVAIVLGIAIGSASKPRYDIAAFLQPSLGELGSYVAGILAVALLGAVLGLAIHAVFARLSSSQTRKGERGRKRGANTKYR